MQKQTETLANKLDLSRELLNIVERILEYYTKSHAFYQKSKTHTYTHSYRTILSCQVLSLRFVTLERCHRRV